MLIDWITARIPLDRLSPEAVEICRGFGDRIQRYCPKTGEIRYETSAWESVRSDSHQISVRVGSDLWVQGSPARCIGDGCSVFGAGASAALDLPGSLARMLAHVETVMGVSLPPVPGWLVSRVDVTGNLELDALSEVREALRVLRDCEGGRYRVSQQAGDSVYWGGKSKHRKGKAYAKGPQLAYLLKKDSYTGRTYNAVELQQAERLLRLELTLGREFWARHDWRAITPEQLKEQWRSYFERMVGSAEMQTDNDVQTRILAVAETEGRGRAAYGCWLMIQAQGWERARRAYAKRTWYRHLKTLRAAGLGDADISAGRVVPLRRRVMEARMVTSWDDLKAA